MVSVEGGAGKDLGVGGVGGVGTEGSGEVEGVGNNRGDGECVSAIFPFCDSGLQLAWSVTIRKAKARIASSLLLISTTPNSIHKI